MAPKFGTSGLRGLVTELTTDLVADHIRAFAAACPMGTGLWVGRDLRASSPDLAAVVIGAQITEVQKAFIPRFEADDVTEDGRVFDRLLAEGGEISLTEMSDDALLQLVRLDLRAASHEG